MFALPVYIFAWKHFSTFQNKYKYICFNFFSTFYIKVRENTPYIQCCQITTSFQASSREFFIFLIYTLTAKTNTSFWLILPCTTKAQPLRSRHFRAFIILWCEAEFHNSLQTDSQNYSIHGLKYQRSVMYVGHQVTVTWGVCYEVVFTLPRTDPRPFQQNKNNKFYAWTMFRHCVMATELLQWPPPTLWKSLPPQKWHQFNICNFLYV